MINMFVGIALAIVFVGVPIAIYELYHYFTDDDYYFYKFWEK